MSASVVHKSAAGAHARRAAPKVAAPEVAAPEGRPAGGPDGLRQAAPPRAPRRWLRAAAGMVRDQPAGAHRAAGRWRLAWRAGLHRGD
jgi:hypothetical protein